MVIAEVDTPCRGPLPSQRVLIGEQADEARRPPACPASFYLPPPPLKVAFTQPPASLFVSRGRDRYSADAKATAAQGSETIPVSGYRTP
jgi:hypothetical protein